MVSERDALFLEKFSHEWSGWVLIVFALLIVIAVVASRVRKRFSPNAGVVRASKVANWAVGTGALLFLGTQTHYPCAVIANHKYNCLSNVLDLARSQNLYAEDHDGYLLGANDWMSRLPMQNGDMGSTARCAGAEGPISYTLNKSLVGVSTATLGDFAVTPEVFDADGKTVCSEECLARGRHLDSPMIGFADGHAAPARATKPLKW